MIHSKRSTLNVGGKQIVAIIITIFYWALFYLGHNRHMWTFILLKNQKKLVLTNLSATDS